MSIYGSASSNSHARAEIGRRRGKAIAPVEAGMREDTEVDPELYEQVASVVDAYREKYDVVGECGEIARIVCGELTKAGHVASVVDNGSHVFVKDVTSREYVDFAAGGFGEDKRVVGFDDFDAYQYES